MSTCTIGRCRSGGNTRLNTLCSRAIDTLPAPEAADDLDLQLTTMLLEKALYELRYELNMRPEWVRIPLRGILEVVSPA